MLGIVNDPARAYRLSYRKRHELVRELENDPVHAGRIDRRLETLLDLVQAGEAPNPCAVFTHALDMVELDPGPHNAATLMQAKVPMGPGCEGLDARLAALVDGRPADAIGEASLPSDERKKLRERGRGAGQASQPVTATSERSTHPRGGDSLERPGRGRQRDQNPYE